MNRKNLVVFLREEREKRGFTHKQLAQAVKISEKTYRDIEEGTVEMDIRVCAELARVFQIPIGELLEFWK